MTDLFKDKADDFDSNDIPRQLSMGIGSSMLQNVELHDGMEVMDFGAGTGLITAHVTDKVGKITAVDVSEAMLEKLASKEELKGKVEIICQDILEKPLDRKFDLIVSAMAMHHVKDTDQLLARFSEHLKPGARVALADLDTEDGDFHPEDVEGVYHSGFDREELMEKMQSNGFRNIRFTTAYTLEKDTKTYPIFLALADKG
ncbi:MAG: class I SAM-dependent methyltransferase [Gammaproteobacteria bacterium]|nr:class I SAM-dependent methyltransferase [Gammaproteobacteria bacterium]